MNLFNSGLRFFKTHFFLRKVIFYGWLADAHFKLSHIVRHLKSSDKILDIGAGPCSVCFLLKRMGYDTTAVDIIDLSMVEEIKPDIYDGKNLPYADKSFDVALILTVLHHTENHRDIIREARRTAERIIIIEDVYSNLFNKRLMFFADSLLNLEFKGHPHSNRTDQGWKELFNRLNLNLIHTEYKRILLIFRQAVYVLE